MTTPSSTAAQVRWVITTSTRMLDGADGCAAGDLMWLANATTDHDG